MLKSPFILLHIPSYPNTIWPFIILFLFCLTVFYIIHAIRVKSILRSQLLVKRERNLLKSLIDNIPDTIYFKDRNSRFLLINKAQVEVLGLRKAEEAYGKTDFDFFKHAQIAYEEEQEIMKTETPVINHIIEIDSVPGQHMYLMETKFPMYDENNKCIGLVGISRNITELMVLQKDLIRARDKAEQADRLKSVFLSNMSHEIRTPLNCIVGFSNLLADPDFSREEQKKFVHLIRYNNDLLLKLINDILDFSKIESGTLEVEPSIFSVNELFHEIIESNKIDLKESVHLYFRPQYPDLVIQTDKNKLVQVLNNLIINSKKFTHGGTIEAGYSVLGDTQMEFFVKDTGIGIPSDKIETIFDSFIKIDSFSQGNGLGLSICKSIVKLLGGKINVVSEPGKGSTFTFSIKMKKIITV